MTQDRRINDRHPDRPLDWSDTEPLAGQVWTAPLGSAAAAQAAVPAELANMEVLTASEIASRPLPAGRQFVRLTDVQAMLGALAAPAVPSPPLTAGPADSLLGSHINHTAGFLYAQTKASPPLSEGLTDERIVEVIARIGSQSLNVTRMHEVGGKTTTVMENEGVIEFARAIEREVIARLSAPPSPTLHGAVGATNCTVTGGEREGNRVTVDMDARPSTHLWTMGSRAYLCESAPASTQSGAAAAPRQDAWISMTKRQPKDCEIVLVYHRDPHDPEPKIWSAQWLEGSETFESTAIGWVHAEEVSHWMPLPPTPVSAPDGGDERKETGE